MAQHRPKNEWHQQRVVDMLLYMTENVSAKSEWRRSGWMKFKCSRWLLTNCSILNAITITHWQFYGRIRICCRQYIKINGAERRVLHVLRNMWWRMRSAIHCSVVNFGMPISKIQHDLQHSCFWLNSPEDYTANIIHLDTVLQYALSKIEFEYLPKRNWDFYCHRIEINACFGAIEQYWY